MQERGGGTTVSVAIAEGSHPVPFRTRKLSPPAPMVLPWRRGGRVGRRRDIFATGAARRGGSRRFRARSRWRGALARYAWRMPRALSPRHGKTAHGTPRRSAPLPRDVVDDVRQTARPQQAQVALG